MKYLIHIIGILSLLLINVNCRHSVYRGEAPYPSDNWPTASFRSVDMNGKAIHNLDANIEIGWYGNTDEVLIIKNGKKVFHKTYDHDYVALSRGKNDALGCGFRACEDSSQINEFNYYHPRFHPWYRGREVHSLQSITKSVSATLIGVAMMQGHISNLDAKVLTFFSDYSDINTDPDLEDVRIQDLLCMQMGMEWHENDRPLDYTNTTLQLEKSADWMRFILSQPMVNEPGEKWVYNSGASHLMSGIIKESTDRFIDRYAEEYLFRPLGIQYYHWKKDPQGFPDTEGGLYLTASDLARIAYLYLHQGNWKGKQILPVDWVGKATGVQAENVYTNGWDYGFQWWRVDDKGTEIWAAMGFGDQYLLVLPEYNTIGIAYSWNIFGGDHRNILRDLRLALLLANQK